MVSDEYTSSFITHEIQPGIYTFNNLSETLFRTLQPEFEGFHKAIDVKLDEISMKIQFVVRFGIIAIRFDEKMF